MENKIEKLRQELYVLIQSNKLTDRNVILKSQQLQKEINNFMKENLNVKSL
ncbi:MULTISPECIES: aspartyl-phosphate phosphatase Spo0E family protein [Clostridium]|uniref:aspartyl-phosphate phosphatase Spo0E family protein n=1 Tax=Clostridium TaxID=1485 RepID=UPI0009BE1480|nr:MULTISPECIES: aspartyl-phosphate phosphatase Spo0E family protein [Clostridium]PJI10225.1 aspartyl-phosphate phosphatase Spo0E family protein [Clostridium sp. CT7]